MRCQPQHTSLFVAFALWINASGAFAQGAGVTVAGTVIDSVAGLPIPDVAIYVGDRTLACATDINGDFELPELSTGEHLAYFMKNGYVPDTVQFTVTEQMHGLIDAGILLLSEGPPPVATLSGQVVDAQNQDLLARVTVSVNDQASTTTDTSGNFILPPMEVYWGANTLHFERLGYAPIESELWVAEQELELNLDVALSPVAIPLPDVVVAGERPATRLTLAGFYHRSEHEKGVFLTEDDWVERPTSNVAQVLQRINGVNVLGWRVMISSVSALCRQQGRSARVVLDGVETYREIIQDLNIDSVAGIEVYTSVANLPPRYNFGAMCGLVLIWTK